MTIGAGLLSAIDLERYVTLVMLVSHTAGHTDVLGEQTSPPTPTKGGPPAYARKVSAKFTNTTVRATHRGSRGGWLAVRKEARRRDCGASLFFVARKRNTKVSLV